jgi:hypothetical protein
LEAARPSLITEAEEAGVFFFLNESKKKHPPTSVFVLINSALIELPGASQRKWSSKPPNTKTKPPGEEVHVENVVQKGFAKLLLQHWHPLCSCSQRHRGASRGCGVTEEMCAY